MLFAYPQVRNGSYYIVGGFKEAYCNLASYFDCNIHSITVLNQIKTLVLLLKIDANAIKLDCPILPHR